jgi:hypothetical protein
VTTIVRGQKRRKRWKRKKEKRGMNMNEAEGK